MELYHHGIKGQKWGVRRYQYADGTYTPAGRKGDGEEDNTMHHCFENDNSGTVLKHSLDDINGIIATASKHGTLRDAFLDAGITGDELAHSIENMDYLFPDDHNLDTVPRIVDRDQTWVDKVMNSVHHVPFARVKVMFADLTEDDARAKGWQRHCSPAGPRLGRL